VGTPWNAGFGAQNNTPVRTGEAYLVNQPIAPNNPLNNAQNPLLTSVYGFQSALNNASVPQNTQFVPSTHPYQNTPQGGLQNVYQGLQNQGFQGNTQQTPQPPATNLYPLPLFLFTNPDTKDPRFQLMNRGGSLKERQFNETYNRAIGLPAGGVQELQRIYALQNAGIQPNNAIPYANVPWGGNMYTPTQNNPYSYPVTNWPAWPTYSGLPQGYINAQQTRSFPSIASNIPAQWTNYALNTGGYLPQYAI
jgi:hypothetical protein